MTELLQRVRAGLLAVAQPERAPKMQAYMKSAMPYHGVPSVPASQVFKAAFQGLSWPTREAWEAEVLGLWSGATHREERYAALALTKHKAARPFQLPEALPLYERLLVEGAWWDFVDDLAIHSVGPLLLAHPEAIRPRILAWSQGEDLWLRRSAIICQVGAKERIDLALLEATIAPAMHEKAFFLRKGIGWALRQHAWRDPAWVQAYVARHESELSGLSKREALKNLRPTAST